jgi:[ribosomal protein S5]-alanine N-acetyltransferase
MTSPRIPVIETSRLVLRGPIPADVDVYATFLIDPDFTRYLGRLKVKRTLQERAERRIRIHQERWETQPLSAMGWAATRKEDGQFIGLCGVEVDPGTNDGELDYRVGKSHWGLGFATEAARAAVRFAFEHTTWDRIVAAIAPANIASRRVLDHLGFVYEKHVNYFELTGIDSIELDDPIVALYALRREQYQPDTAFYRVIESTLS